MRNLRSWIVWLGSLTVGGIFIVAGVLKSLDVEGFARDIALHRILGSAPSAVLALVLIPFEIVVGTAVILGYRRRAGLGLLIAALGVFAAGTGWAWWHGNTEGCGCFGRFASRTPSAVIIEDLLLIVAAAIALVLSPPSQRTNRLGPPAGARRTPIFWKPALLGSLAVISLAFSLASPSLPIDDLATALRPGVSLHELGLDGIAGHLAEGDRLLAILVLDEDASRAAIERLNSLARIPGLPPLTALTSAGEQARAEFFFAYAPSFDILEVPSADLRRLYRRAPRAFRVHNGAVLRVWNGVPPAEDFAR